MKKINKEKRLKFTTNTYMKEAVNYQIVIIKDNPDYFVTIKKYDEVTKPFILTNHHGKDITYFANGYYLVEFTPLNDYYNIRFYYNEKKELVDFYIDISLENGIKYKLPYYTDLYLDILNREGTVSFTDEDELSSALAENKISKRDYDFAYKIGKRVKREVEAGENFFINLDKVAIINKYFKDNI